MAKKSHFTVKRVGPPVGKHRNSGDALPGGQGLRPNYLLGRFLGSFRWVSMPSKVMFYKANSNGRIKSDVEVGEDWR